jgi:adenylate cyclase
MSWQSRGTQALAAGVTVFAAVLLLRVAGALERMELAAYDLGLRARPAAAVDDRLLIIDETEEDLQRFGHPLPDETLAKIVERLLALGPRVLGVDKFRDIPVPPGTEALERAVTAHRNVFWIYQFGGNGARRIAPPQWLGRAAQAGFVDVLVDPGGVVRRGLLYLDDGGRPQASFALTLALAYLARDGISPRPDPADPALMRLGAATIAPFEPHDGGYAGADASGYQMLLDFHGAPAPFARVTVGELLDGKVDAALARDRIAIVGSSADSLKDFFHTPFSSKAAQYITGAELQAHHASQLLRLARGDSAPVRTLPKAAEIALLALCCALGLVAWLATRGKQLAALIAGGLAALAIVWFAAAAAAIWLPVVPLALGFVITASASAGLRALHEARERAALMAIFSRHVAPEVARELWERRSELADGYSLRPRRLDATVLFADLHGYTPVAARLAPEETARWLNEFIGPMAEIIMAHRGVIRQYAGDAIMAIFGAPIPSETREQCERDARTAVACAQEMCGKFAALNEAWRRAGKPTAGLRIGLYSGPMVGCNIGSRQRLEYAVVGDAVNVAARLQSLTLPDGDEGERGRILLGEETRARLPVHEPCERIGSFVLKGRSEALSVYRIVTQLGG